MCSRALQCLSLYTKISSFVIIIHKSVDFESCDVIARNLELILIFKRVS